MNEAAIQHLAERLVREHRAGLYSWRELVQHIQRRHARHYGALWNEVARIW